MLTEGLDAHCSQCVLVQNVWRTRRDRGQCLENSPCLAPGLGTARVKDATSPRGLTWKHLRETLSRERREVRNGARGTTSRVCTFTRTLHFPEGYGKRSEQRD